jgi:hypothetical protein
MQPTISHGGGQPLTDAVQGGIGPIGARKELVALTATVRARKASEEKILSCQHGNIKVTIGCEGLPSFWGPLWSEV